jgi:hypothetical protein
MIGLHGLPMNRGSLNFAAVVDRELLIPLSRDTLQGGTAQGFVVIEAPDIARNVDKRLH